MIVADGELCEVREGRGGWWDGEPVEGREQGRTGRGELGALMSVLLGAGTKGTALASWGRGPVPRHGHGTWEQRLLASSRRGGPPHQVLGAADAGRTLRPATWEWGVAGFEPPRCAETRAAADVLRFLRTAPGGRGQGGVGVPQPPDAPVPEQSSSSLPPPQHRHLADARGYHGLTPPETLPTPLSSTPAYYYSLSAKVSLLPLKWSLLDLGRQIAEPNATQSPTGATVA
ncbi:hypothetical protein BDZ91DRAFT_764701 [Kalaharituber pfeilii]|nr:hypothetical protein BDZ91DRAFT_764701 [Kalaharituber pfeilii]